ncbi:MAG: DUF4911 domain-containing protein [Desulfuromonas sp.]|nr:MAG: DUF4911 domain-containing protein [Desulfuromonas sp.]
MVDAIFCKKYYILEKAEIAYLRFVLESYDGLAFVRTLDKTGALVEVAYPPSRSADAEILLAALEQETGMTETATPAEGMYQPI